MRMAWRKSSSNLSHSCIYTCSCSSLPILVNSASSRLDSQLYFISAQAENQTASFLSIPDSALLSQLPLFPSSCIPASISFSSVPSFPKSLPALLSSSLPSYSASSFEFQHCLCVFSALICALLPSFLRKADLFNWEFSLNYHFAPTIKETRENT